MTATQAACVALVLGVALVIALFVAVVRQARAQNARWARWAAEDAAKYETYMRQRGWR